MLLLTLASSFRLSHDWLAKHLAKLYGTSHKTHHIWILQNYSYKICMFIFYNQQVMLKYIHYCMPTNIILSYLQYATVWQYVVYVRMLYVLYLQWMLSEMCMYRMYNYLLFIYYILHKISLQHLYFVLLVINTHYMYTCIYTCMYVCRYVHTHVYVHALCICVYTLFVHKNVMQLL